MPIIVLETHITAPIEKCFDLSRSIDLHMLSTAETGEKAIRGVTSGLIGLNETVTWRAKHFGIWFELTSKITEFNYPNSFTDEMQEGIFKFIYHKHDFFAVADGTLMKDHFAFESPLGFLGQIANALVVTKHLTYFLEKRNAVIKLHAER